MTSPDARRLDGRIPYESTERAERHGRVRCQALERIEITDHGAIEIAGIGVLNIVGGARRRADASVREVSIQETNREKPNGPEGPNHEREFVVLMTLNVERNARAPRPAPDRPPQRRKVEPDGAETERTRNDGECVADDRQNRWQRRKGRRGKQGSAGSAHTNRDGPRKGRSRDKGRNLEWDAERY